MSNIIPHKSWNPWSIKAKAKVAADEEKALKKEEKARDFEIEVEKTQRLNLLRKRRNLKPISNNNDISDDKRSLKKIIKNSKAKKNTTLAKSLAKSDWKNKNGLIPWYIGGIKNKEESSPTINSRKELEEIPSGTLNQNIDNETSSSLLAEQLLYNETQRLIEEMNSTGKKFGIYYIDSLIGNDNNDGSITQPYQTIQKAIDQRGIDNAIEVEIYLNGTFTSTNNNDLSISTNTGTQTRSLIITTWPNAPISAKIIIADGFGTFLSIQNYDDILITNIHFESTQMNESTGSSWSFLNFNDANDILVSDCTFERTWKHGIQISSSSANFRMLRSSFTNTPLISDGAYNLIDARNALSILLDDVTTDSCDDDGNFLRFDFAQDGSFFTILNSDISGPGCRVTVVVAGDTAGSFNGLIEDSTFHNVSRTVDSGAALRLSGAASPGFDTIVTYIIRRSNFLRNSSTRGAVRLQQLSDITFEDCLFEENYSGLTGAAVYIEDGDDDFVPPLSFVPRVRFIECEFTRNFVDATRDHIAIHAVNQWLNTIELTDCHIHHHNQGRHGVISFTNVGTVILRNNLFEYNNIDGDSVIRFEGNDLSNQPSSYPSPIPMDVIMEGNIIQYHTFESRVVSFRRVSSNNQFGTVVISGNRLQHNRGGSSLALWHIHEENPLNNIWTVKDSIFLNNTGADAVLLFDNEEGTLQDVSIENCIFDSNTGLTGGVGSAIQIRTSNLAITGNTIITRSNHEGTNEDGAIGCRYTGSITTTSSVYLNNQIGGTTSYADRDGDCLPIFSSFSDECLNGCVGELTTCIISVDSANCGCMAGSEAINSEDLSEGCACTSDYLPRDDGYPGCILIDNDDDEEGGNNILSALIIAGISLGVVLIIGGVIFNRSKKSRAVKDKENETGKTTQSLIAGSTRKKGSPNRKGSPGKKGSPTRRGGNGRGRGRGRGRGGGRGGGGGKNLSDDTVTDVSEVLTRVGIAEVGDQSTDDDDLTSIGTLASQISY